MTESTPTTPYRMQCRDCGTVAVTPNPWSAHLRAQAHSNVFNHETIVYGYTVVYSPFKPNPTPFAEVV